MSSRPPVDPLPPGVDPVPEVSTGGNSYGEILKSSSMVGGSAAVNVLIGMARAKAGALFLGPEGVGIVGLYYNLIGMLQTLSGMGINASGVRQVAAAAGSGDSEQIGHTVRVLRKVCWVTGIGGWVLAAALAWPLSSWVFGDHEHVGSIALIGMVLLFGTISGGQMALVQGMRRIADLAKFNVVSALLTAVAAIICYWQLGKHGIVPAILLGGALTLANSWWFARRIEVPESGEIGFIEALGNAREMLGLGLAFMWTGLLQTAVMLAQASMIIKFLGLAANGYSSAAWSISGAFSNMILGAMGADYYPRLTEASNDHPKMRRLVNEQTEIGLLIAVPVLGGVIIFAPLAIQIFYSADFSESVILLQWFALGLLGRIVSWPMGFIILAKGRSALFAAIETCSHLFHLALALACLYWIGLKGIAVAFFLIYLIYSVVLIIVSRTLIGYRWSGSTFRLVVISGAILATCFLVSNVFSSTVGYIAGGGLLCVVGLFCLRGLSLRLGKSHRLVKLALRLPGIELLLNIKSPFAKKG